MKRYLIPIVDWDTRASLLQQEIKDDWAEELKETWRRNKEEISERLRKEYGEGRSGQTVKDFTDLGAKPLSIISYHNGLMDQCRAAFTAGAYYPALTGVCSLGERILNHLIIDLRDDYKDTPEYCEVRDQKTFSNWRIMTTTLKSWGVFNDDVAANFKNLAKLRQRSVHFNENLTTSLRNDALRALAFFQDIIRVQFGSFGSCWTIDGTAGQVFLRKELETHPFIKKYYIPQCPLVGHLFSIRLGRQSWEYCDFINYEDREISDAEFCHLYNTRKPEEMAPSADPLPSTLGVIRLVWGPRH
jgi:hypothetical protein